MMSLCTGFISGPVVICILIDFLGMKGKNMLLLSMQDLNVLFWHEYA